MSSLMDALSCPGCAKGFPIIATELLMQGGLSTLPAGWRACLHHNGLHAPGRAEFDRVMDLVMVKQGEGRKGRAPAGPLPRVQGAHPPLLERDIRSDTKATLAAIGYDAMDFEQGYRPGICFDCNRPAGKGGRCPDCEKKLRSSSRVPRGVGDLYVVGHGVGFWIELKVPGRDRTTDQQGFALRVRRGGTWCYLVTDASQVYAIEALRRELGRLPSEDEFHAALQELKEA